MTHPFKPQLALVVALGSCLIFSQAARAQGGPGSGPQFTAGNIQMGANGPVGVLSGTTVGGVNSGVTFGANGASGSFSNGLINGSSNITNGGQFSGNLSGPGGGAAFTNSSNPGNFGFNMNGALSPNNGINNGVNPQFQNQGGQQQGYTGPGSYGNAYSSQGATGDFGRTSNQTANLQCQQDPYPYSYAYNPKLTTQKQNAPLRETARNNLLSTFSVDPSPYPSGSFTYGFPTWGGWIGTGIGVFTKGWYMPPTSTSSVDINTVSP